ncbi:MAG TPA: sugar ABC transporter ATP-binding protein [Aggregatilineales bacterium]|nr:sugar ABC transporter ATP-binding protein [Aggregatilineales bacterium]
MAAPDKLIIRSVSKAFAGVRALSDVSFTVQRGQLHALLGENGAGKSTLIKILSGAQSVDSGDILLDDRPYSPRSPVDAVRRGVSTIYQEANLLPDRDVVSNVMLGMEDTLGEATHGILNQRVMRARVRDLLHRLHADSIELNWRAGTLKVGEKQLLEIARALLQRADLLIMDEPTAALNRDETSALFDVIRDLKAHGVTILYVSHRLEEVFQLADSVTVLRDGKHIRTAALSEVTPDSLITDMIGRRLETVFPPRSQAIGAAVFTAEAVSAQGTFEDVSFTLHAGEVVGLTGVGGSGHVELGKALFGAHPLDSGTICVRGAKVQPSPSALMERGVIFLPEDRKAEGVIPALPVRRNLAMSVLPRVASRLGVLSRRAEEAFAQKQVDQLRIKTAGLGQLAGNLSGGNQQKVALGRGLATGGNILILMGATQGIDVGVKFEIYELVAQLTAEGSAVLFVSAEIPEILGLCHRILVMHRGRLVATLDGPTASAEQVLRYALGQPGAPGEST